MPAAAPADRRRPSAGVLGPGGRRPLRRRRRQKRHRRARTGNRLWRCRPETPRLGTSRLDIVVQWGESHQPTAKADRQSSHLPFADVSPPRDQPFGRLERRGVGAARPQHRPFEAELLQSFGRGNFLDLQPGHRPSSSCSMAPRLWAGISHVRGRDAFPRWRHPDSLPVGASAPGSGWGGAGRHDSDPPLWGGGRGGCIRGFPPIPAFPRQGEGASTRSHGYLALHLAPMTRRSRGSFCAGHTGRI
jgi:hypothetical protein